MSEALLDFLRRRYALEPQVEALVRRLTAAWEQGHSALPLSAAEAELLRTCPAVGDEQTARPLRLLPGPRLQSWRLHQAEQRIWAKLTALAAQPPRRLDAAVRKKLALLFPEPADAQYQAARAGLEGCFTLISGGPGTGKTHTAARLLALCLDREPRLRCALAAPTGKAAQRLGESVAAAAAHLPQVLAGVGAALQAVGAGAQTLHRLLAWRPELDRCAYDAARPLPLDLLLVDEAGMLDVMLWDALLQALPKQARLVVLGDPRQLESIQPGRVLGSLVEMAAAPGPLQGCHVELTRNHRFARFPGIGALAEAIRRNDGAALLQTFEESAEVARLDNADLDAALDCVWPQILALAQAREPEAALQALGRVRVLCALNQGPWGVSGLNARIEARLRRQGLFQYSRPVLVQVNDPSSGLFNGDLGVLLPEAGGARAYFGVPPKVHALDDAQLPEHSLAWAMTVHRSQGSEYDQILLVLPPYAHELLSPELLYTAVTRAKEKVWVVAEKAVLSAAVRAREKRVTGWGAA
jgi:exodeoxyribonuclease V alpha subunit